ncbi:SDR family oxidoreductase [Spirosoma foliorum]|uniref:SDR family oxidoreductase n=2 Tax=Spirosoma foliorum TaxID=2710596 RepID=A0A7G5H6Z8_9BACT|nr:SDR family oxidoreductase [Spirosoma foliorum]
MSDLHEKVWFITGASKGFGLTLTKLLLANGQKVSATSRDKKSIEAETGFHKGLLALTVDLTDESDVIKAINGTVDHFGRIDVVVNNAGYMLLGSLEEVSNSEFQQSMNLNVFAFLNVIRNIMPHFRKQHSGHIFNYSSSAGYGGDASAGSYNAVKSAIIGFSEALAKEVQPFNIKVTIVSPGLFRTSFLAAGSFTTAKNLIDGYPTQRLVDTMTQYNGQQPSNPEKLAMILVDTAKMADPPLHLVMGEDAFAKATSYYHNQLVALEKNKKSSLSTNF